MLGGLSFLHEWKMYYHFVRKYLNATNLDRYITDKIYYFQMFINNSTFYNCKPIQIQENILFLSFFACAESTENFVI